MSKKQEVEVRKRRRPRSGRDPAVKSAAGGKPHDEGVPWRRVRGGTALYRSYHFPDPAVATSFSQFAIAMAARARLPLFVRLLDSQVTLALRGEGSRRLPPLAAELFDRLAAFT
jgi:hypothetical protein